MITVLCSACSIQKRVHRRGWHIEWAASRDASPWPQRLKRDMEPMQPMDSAVQCFQSFSVGAVRPKTKVSTGEVTWTKRYPKHEGIGQRGILRRPADQVANDNAIGKKQMHPKAGLSFLLGAMSLACVIVPVLVSGLGLAIIIGLAIALVVLALLAQKMSRIALEDMHMARHRYSGKALAAAGLILSVLALVALVGIVVIALLGAAFLTVA